MAKPTGAVTAGNLVYIIHQATSGKGADPETPQWIYYVFKAQQQHQEWETNNTPGTLMTHKIVRQIDQTPTATTLEEVFFVGDDVKPALANVPHQKSGVFAGELEDQQVDAPAGKIMSGRSEVKYIVARHKVNVSTTGGYEDVTLFHCAFEAVNDTAYSGTGVEMVRRDSGVDRLYDADKPCSAWHVMKGLKETHRRILYECRPAFSVPLFGDATNY